MTEPVEIVGAGLAGSECAWQLARQGVAVRLYEMRPERTTPAHTTGSFAELVCSNSLRSDDPTHPAGLLKREMERLGSLVVMAARATSVPAGAALAVDRQRFSRFITEKLEAQPRIDICRVEVKELPKGDGVVATGPLTSDALSHRLAALLGADHLHFYDAIAPIVDADSLDFSRLFWASRYGKGDEPAYLNAALDRLAYEEFHRALLEAEVLPLRDFEEPRFFEGCLPVEELARRGEDTLRYGPMKPVGLVSPDGTRPFSVVQLRRENLADTYFNLVGFQTRLKYQEQDRVFRLIPGLENAVIVRHGQVHRNTFIKAPLHLDLHYRLREQPSLRLAGQITGVEGYLESAATGLVIGYYMALERQGQSPKSLPFTTALGALGRHLTLTDPARFQPSNIHYGLFEPLRPMPPKKNRRELLAARAEEDLKRWSDDHGVHRVESCASS